MGYSPWDLKKLDTRQSKSVPYVAAIKFGSQDVCKSSLAGVMSALKHSKGGARQFLYPEGILAGS